MRDALGRLETGVLLPTLTNRLEVITRTQEQFRQLVAGLSDGEDLNLVLSSEKICY